MVLIGITFLALFYRAMGRDLNHDEHQFLAPGVLLSREGLLPYRDYPLFHVPNLVFAYAAMDWITGDVIFGAKLLSAVASTGVVMLLFWTALSRMSNSLTPLQRFWLATGASILLLFDPLFLYTSGKTWNHEVPAFLLALAVVFHVESFRAHPLLFSTLSGCAAGLAAGTRLTYAPPCAAFVIHLLIAGGKTWRERVKLLVAWGGGCFVGLLPCIYFLVTCTDAFLFDNLKFPRLRLLDTDNERIQKTMTLWRKVRFLVKEVISRSWPLAVLYVGLGIIPMFQAVRSRRFSSGAIFTLLLGLCVIAGCFTPARYQYQHFYAMSVVGALGIVYRCKEGQLSKNARRILLIAIGVFAVISIVGFLDKKENRPNGWRAYLEARAMRDPGIWFTTRYRQQYGVLQRHIPPGGRVLTLAPTAVLAADRRICPEFATGPFAWRSAEFVEPGKRAKLGFVGPADLAEHVKTERPIGILTGVEDDELEKPLIEFAERGGYRKIELPRNKTLWLLGEQTPPLKRPN